MSLSVRRLGALVLVAAVAKQAAWALWLPPGSLPDENAQYGAIARADLTSDQSLRPLVPKDLAELARFSRMESGRLPVRSDGDRRKLDETLSGLDDTVLVPGDLSATSRSTYHELAGRVLRGLRGIDFRWRWIMLRALGIGLLVLAALLTSGALRAGLPGDGFIPVTGMALIMFGPPAGFGAATLGPSPLLAALWAGWVFCVVQVMRQAWWAALWAALAGLAISSIHPQGAAACLATLVALAAARACPRGALHRGARLAAIALSLLGLALWAFRMLTFEFPEASPPGWRAWLFAAPAELHPAPCGILTGWGIVVLVALAGLVRVARAGEGSLALPISAAAVVCLVSFWRAPASGVGSLSIAPLMAVAGAMGLAAVCTSNVSRVAVLAAVMVLDWATLIAWVMPRLYQWH
ncbi:MAG: hypothetical protein MUE60_06390 [Candidatus Eisenbacteria bacterium]|jgi:hypothetical protein|nr:hypothetical protein [Candidatus Eisenbacteria bacterium]